VLRRLLENRGHQVEVAADGLEALNLVGATPFDVAIVDMYMPRMDGLQLIPKLRVQSPHTKVVAMSGGILGGKGKDLLSEATRLGAERALEKPFGVDALTKTLDELLG
jgi:CheY-like chemotaxis protein